MPVLVTAIPNRGCEPAGNVGPPWVIASTLIERSAQISWPCALYDGGGGAVVFGAAVVVAVVFGGALVVVAAAVAPFVAEGAVGAVVVVPAVVLVPVTVWAAVDVTVDVTVVPAGPVVDAAAGDVVDAAVDASAVVDPVGPASAEDAAVESDVAAGSFVVVSVARTPVSWGEVVVTVSAAGSAEPFPDPRPTTHHTTPTTTTTASAAANVRRSQYTPWLRGPTGCITWLTVACGR